MKRTDMDGVTKREAEGINEGIFACSGMWREWRMIRMLRECMEGGVQVVTR